MGQCVAVETVFLNSLTKKPKKMKESRKKSANRGRRRLNRKEAVQINLAGLGVLMERKKGIQTLQPSSAQRRRRLTRKEAVQINLAGLAVLMERKKGIQTLQPSSAQRRRR